MTMIDLPRPSYAMYPDNGVEMYGFAAGVSDRFTRHEDGLIRVWRTAHQRDAWPYYQIDDAHLDEEELKRAVVVALKLLSVPVNRKSKRRLNA